MVSDRRSCPALLLALCSPACSGAPRQLEPRTPPSRAELRVTLPSSEIPRGHGRVALGATDGPMRVVSRRSRTSPTPDAQAMPTRTGDLCVTPCVVDLPIGRYDLHLSSADGSVEHEDEDQLVVGPGTSYYLRAPGRYEPADWVQVGPAFALVGAIILVIAGTGTLAASSRGSSSRPVTGAVMLGGGIGLGIGAWLWNDEAGRATAQEGATTFWKE